MQGFRHEGDENVHICMYGPIKQATELTTIKTLFNSHSEGSRNNLLMYD